MSEEVEVQEEVQEEVQPQETAVEQAVEEKPKSAYIDYDALPEGVRDTVKMRVDGDFRKIKEAERKQAEYERKVKEYEEKLAEFQKPREVSAPTQDDFYEDPDKAQQKLQAYQEYITKNSEWEMQERLRQQQQQEQIARQNAERRDAFLKKADSAGINEHELGYAASVVAPQLGEDVAAYLMDHEYGPQILKQLASNPMDLQEVASLNPYQVGVKLDKIAKAFKPTKVSKAPPPDDPIQGSGVDARDDYPALKGGTFL